MAEPDFKEPEFNATGVRIERSLRSLTRAGQVKIKDGRLELLTSYGREIDSAPVDSVRADRPWFASRDRARARVNGTRYVLTLSPEEGGAEESGTSAVQRFLEAVRSARGGGTGG
ncbi:hypothetical protein [Streptomyces sp. UNOC14_S4]|uniref:hypothetical protein n=1 Tax=Streptomyces sp. UNOC14_S4 TaxID=2872340 RepID=UPI001E58710C|nr:hypothetical protein [Streptomyces sp. UNOC14_S4]MCC3766114.1 hypothetical protein [Streptomyces sp. UNOC14_S4]